MHKLACKDIGLSSDCEFEATGATVDEAVDLEMEHAKSTHADEIAATGLSDDDLRASAGAKVREEGGESSPDDGDDEDSDDEEDEDDGEEKGDGKEPETE